MKISIDLEGDKQIMRLFDGVSKNLKDRSLVEAARKGSKILIDDARSNISQGVESYVSRSTKDRKNKGINKNLQSKASYIKRNIKAKEPSKRYGLGVNVGVYGKDIPVGDRYWDILGYAQLLAKGAYVKKLRFTRKSKAYRGVFDGFGHFMNNALAKKGNIALAEMRKSAKKTLDELMEKEYAKHIKKLRG